MIRAPHLGMALRVWRRNARIFLKLWRGSLLPPFLDPILYLLALGLGLGAYVSSVDGVPYREFLAPALCVSAAMWAATFETTFAFFWRMTESRVHDTILATPIEAEDVVLGELLWAGTRALVYGTSFLTVIAALGYVESPWAILLPPFLFLGGIAFGALGMSYSVLITKMDYFTFFFTLVVNPMFLFGGIFFPYSSLPQWAQAIAWLTPTLHLVEISRALAQGASSATVLTNSAWLVIAATLMALVPLRRLRQRLVA